MERIIHLIPSSSLKKYIKENDICFEPYELMQLADDYARSYEERMELLKLLLPVSKRLIENRKRELDLFLSEEPDTVYELRIRLKANDYNEKYFCKSFDSAVKTVKDFLKEYEVEKNELNEKSKIYMTKWRIFGKDSIDFEKSDLGILELNEKLEIKYADYWGENGYTFTYPRKCFDFSDFLSGYHPIQYENDGKVRYAISVPVKCYSVEEDDREELITDEAYALPIDCTVDLNQDDFQFYYHEHVPATELELLEEDELDAFMRSNYKKLKQYFKEIL